MIRPVWYVRKNLCQRDDDERHDELVVNRGPSITIVRAAMIVVVVVMPSRRIHCCAAFSALTL